ncbi:MULTISPECIES: DUF2721 domain-containing protein [Vogesella]|jgi:hypothetical protein|uniref:DUF2721 domain-containing protein n=1 Tax=Vogesella indigofera TaxID=45465 RepID=A0A495B2D3_VOGIN|nr:MULTISPECIES: DUF2721 domain-containing protein [Vogesella]KMJ54103.1 II family cellulose-binding protein [Vogesella sp. EB]MCQ4144941.1 DUF2721 domain-containing protein [Vogesella sp. AC12]MDC7692214.1 DUF2721 domain-containing protein [Vogesella indigofera]MDC7699268.1 DUF2721 domain-containing protein [Vogesella indigofera]RKQ54800.1 uncharacterized protein DUF2721 [Vogesella indigofera]
MLNLTTPALLFPAISLLLLAYTNRYLALASIIRNLYDDYQQTPSDKLVRQIGNLRRRIALIKWMQSMGVGSLFLCVVAMFQIYTGWPQAAQITFGTSLLLLISSLGMSLLELRMSTDALNILLSDLVAAERARDKSPR